MCRGNRLLVAAGLLVGSAWLPLWTMELRAPQYPRGLELTAFGQQCLVEQQV